MTDISREEINALQTGLAKVETRIEAIADQKAKNELTLSALHRRLDDFKETVDAMEDAFKDALTALERTMEDYERALNQAPSQNDIKVLFEEQVQAGFSRFMIRATWGILTAVGAGAMIVWAEAWKWFLQGVK